MSVLVTEYNPQWKIHPGLAAKPILDAYSALKLELARMGVDIEGYTEGKSAFV